ncbi:uncharacterized protein LOC144246701 [Lonchura striata]
MPSVEEEKPESIVLKKISVEKSLHVKEKVSPKETVPAIQPYEYKISLETAGAILNSETDEQEKVSLKYFVLASEEEELEMTPVVSGKTTLTGEKLKVEMDYITYTKEELPLPDEEVKLISITSEHVERDSGEQKEDEIKLLVHREDTIEKGSEKFSVLHEGKIPDHGKEEIESTCIPKPRKPDQPKDLKGLTGKEKKSKKSLQPEKFHIKDKTSFVQDIIEADIAETPQLSDEKERGGFTPEKYEVPLEESMKGHGIQSKIQRLKKSGSTVPEIPIGKIHNKEAKKIEDIQDDETGKNLDFTSPEIHSLDLSEEAQPGLRKDVNLEYPIEDEEVPGEKPHTIFKPSVLKSEVVEMKAREKYSTEKEAHYEEGLGQLLTKKALLSDKKAGKKILPEKEEKTVFSSDLKKGKIRQSNAPESLPVEKEFDTVITGGMESEVPTGEHEKGIIPESVKKVAIQPPQSQDEKQIQEVHTIQDEHKETLADKSRKVKIEEKQSTEGISDEKTSPEHGIGKSTSGTMKKEKGKLIDKVSSSKGILEIEDTYSSSIGKVITSKKAEGEKEYQKSEPAHLTEQASRILSENKNLDAPGESHEVLDVPAKSHAKRGEED